MPRRHPLATLPVTLLSAALTALVAACSTSPTGRSQLVLFPDSVMARMGNASFTQMKQQTPQVRAPEAVDYVQCVADAITAVAGQPGSVKRWEVTVLRDPQVNAFALPGGGIGVYSGLLKVATGQDQLAAVIGHEVGHVLANHGNERVSQEYTAKAALSLAESFTGNLPSAQQSRLMGLLGIGAQYGVLLPYSRTHESEADEIGLTLMAKAGFDPREAVTLWQNMEAQGGRQPAEILSTHPSDQRRIQDLQAHMGQALSLYDQARSQGRRPQCRPPRLGSGGGQGQGGGVSPGESWQGGERWPRRRWRW